MTTALSEPPSKTRFVVYLVACAVFMEMLDGTVITTALPQMARSFHVEPVSLNIGITAYMVTLAIFVPLCGWMADRFGVRTIFGLAILIFTFASILCGMTTSLWGFAAARVLQGLGGAMMAPVGRQVVLQTTAKKDLLVATAIINWPPLVAPILGPPLGGFITDTLSWPWVFYLNVPLGIAGFVLTMALVPNLKHAQRRPLDLAGFTWTALAVSLFVYGVGALGTAHGAYIVPLGCILTGLLLSLGAYRHMNRHPVPLLDFRAMRLRSFSVPVLGGSIFRLTVSTTPFLLPLMFQLVFHMTAFQSGMLVLFIFVGALGFKPATSPLLRRYGFRRALMVSACLTVFAYVACACLTPQTPVWLIALAILYGGACRSMQFTALSALQFCDVPSSEIGAANTVANMAQQMTLGMGVALGALALNASAWLRGLPVGTPDLVDFHNAFLIIAALSILIVFDIRGLARDAGHQVTGRPAEK